MNLVWLKLIARIFALGKACDERLRECTDVHDRWSEEAQRRIKEKYVARRGVIAQLGERLPCTQEVNGSIPFNSTIPTKETCLKFKSKHFTKSLDLSLMLTMLFNNSESW